MPDFASTLHNIALASRARMQVLLAAFLLGKMPVAGIAYC
jgi:hypothetical protein